MTEPTILFVPGLRDHVADHWQSLLQDRLANAECVPRLGKDNLSCDAWVEALDASIRAIRGPIVLVAHSAGVMMVAHWAMRHAGNVRAALLAAPPDFESPLPEGYPSMAALAKNGWVPTPRERLPFESIVAASTNDPLASLDRAAQLAASWGSLLVNAGAVGHLNPASGYCDWPFALDLLAQLGVEPSLRSDSQEPLQANLSWR